MAMDEEELQWTGGEACCPHCDRPWPKWRLEGAGGHYGEGNRVVTFCALDCLCMQYCAPMTDPAGAEHMRDLKRAAAAAAAAVDPSAAAAAAAAVAAKLAMRTLREWA